MNIAHLVMIGFIPQGLGKKIPITSASIAGPFSPNIHERAKAGISILLLQGR
jgi:hypothetical protein